MELPWARQDASGRRGLRVRMSIHEGPVKTMQDGCSERVAYTGEAVRVVKSLERLAVGGQIIASAETLDSAGDLLANVAFYGSHTVAAKKYGKLEPILLDVAEIAPISLRLIGPPPLQQ